MDTIALVVAWIAIAVAALLAPRWIRKHYDIQDCQCDTCHNRRQS